MRQMWYSNPDFREGIFEMNLKILKKYIDFKKCSPECRDDGCPLYKRGGCDPESKETSIRRLKIFKTNLKTNLASILCDKNG